MKSTYKSIGVDARTTANGRDGAGVFTTCRFWIDTRLLAA
jgi:hypothetical protein